MTLSKELFHPEDVLVGFQAADKWHAIDLLVAHLVQTGRLREPLAERCHEAVLARERSMSTGMERGIAIPHAAVEGLEQVVGCLGIVPAKEGLNFESIDHGETHFVVLLLIPRERKLLHIRTLADVARRLSKESVQSALLAAADGPGAWAVLAED